MDRYAVLNEVRSLIDEVKFGILATVDADGYPHQRWMSPVLLPRFSNSLFCVTSERFGKMAQIEKNPKVSWIFQCPRLDKIATVRGLVEVVHDPMLAAEVEEAIGPRLNVFWKYAEEPRILVVLETTIEEYQFFAPLTSIHEYVKAEVCGYED
ncbi:MAG: pyridoxamine 5'-phosphate oxidase family protein [Rectinema sp.]